MKTGSNKDASSVLTLVNCEDEPIHIPGQLQSFAYLLVVDKAFGLHYFSANIHSLAPNISVKPNSNISQIPELAGLCKISSLDTPIEQVIELSGDVYIVRVRAIPEQSELVIIEIELNEPSKTSGKSIYQDSQSIINELFLCKTEEQLANKITETFTHYLQYDCCMLYKFDAEWNGQVIAETLKTERESLLGLHFPAADIPSQARKLYEKKLSRMIVDVDYEPQPLVGLDENSAAVDLTFADSRAISPVHIRYLQNMGVTASLVISLMVKGRLWGMITCHNYSGPNCIPYNERKSCETISTIISLVIERIELTEMEEMKQQLSQELNKSAILNFCQNPNKAHALPRRLLELLNATGFVWFINGNPHHYGKALSFDQIKEVIEQLDLSSQSIVYSDSLTTWLNANDIPDGLAGAAILVFSGNDTTDPIDNCMLIFREKLERTIPWAGNPYEKKIEVTNDIASLSPRNSFSVWREHVHDRSMEWSISDRTIVKEIHQLFLEAHLVELRLQRENELEVVSESSDMGVWSLDLASQHCYWSPKMFSLFGISVDDFGNTYQEWLQLIASEDREVTGRKFEQSIQNRSPYQTTFHIDHPETGKRELRVHANVVLASTGVPFKVVGSAVDITEYQLNSDIIGSVSGGSQNRLASLGELTASIGHEINNPLAIIMNSLELQNLLLAKDVVDRKKLKETTQQALDASERIRKIIAGINSLARNPASRNQKSICKVDTALLEIADMMNGILDKKSIHFSFDVSNVEGALVDIDHTILQQVLINLITNAKDAVDEKKEKTIQVLTEIEANSFLVHVKDSGPGIPQQFIEKVFDSFYTTKPKGKGTGLGLSISRSLLREAGGELTVNSIIDKGSVFTMRLPISSQIPSKSVIDTPQKYTQHLKVLIVDDETDLLNVMSKMLELLGCVVTSTEISSEAKAILSKEKFDILLTDSVMPEVSGEDLIRIATDNGNAKMKILMTGELTKTLSDIKRRNVHVDKLLYKPVTQLDLINLLAGYKATSLDS